ncbi:hypothetical protein K0M31_011748 [Melipona bicolor]|uniref:Uncharacterized protein n=1 Tax=Melipona bicolor TaxID=60889 RepID=A0AA40GBD0_9HYME|nr:hypothetical protein K0M31_011748 [Melipona bicolor]
MKFSSKTNIHINFNPDTEEAKLTNRKKQENDQIFQLDTYVHDEDNLDQEKISQICKLIKHEPKKEKQETKTVTDLAEYKVDLPTDQEEKQESFKYSSRMGGGAEICGSHLISDFHNKMQKINLYKNIKFDAKKVKRRLDACINELNGIIEDVSLILPNMDVTKSLQK